MVCYKTFPKLLFSLIFVCLIFCLTPVNTVAAAEYPIKKDGVYDGVIGYGRSIDGTIYVPLRLLSEVAEAEVNWEAANSTITINRCDGVIIILQPGNTQAKIVYTNNEQKITMPAVAKLQGDTVYVPLRFAAENLLCGVEWDNEAKKVLLQKQFTVMVNETSNKFYILDFVNGKLYERDLNNKIVCLGQSEDIIEFYKTEMGSGWDKHCFSSVVTDIDSGCLLMDIYWDTVDSQMWTFWRLLITPDGVNNRSFICKNAFTQGNLYNDYFDDVNIWWPEKEQVLQLDAQTGETLAVYNYQRLLADMPAVQNYGFAFSDGEYMLLTYQKPETYYSNFPVLVNLRSGQIIDVFAELIPADAQSDFCYDGASPSSNLSFVRAEKGVLYFNYETWQKPDMQLTEQELSYQYR